jgi:Protein of unknown function (DUF2971)
MGEIFHYTDANALINILQKQTLWATHILHLNDPNEYIRPRDIANKIGREISFANTNESHGALDFVVCFSGKKDDLNQFRSYGDDGKGYMIGFDADKLISVLGLSESRLEKIYYGEENYEPHLRKIFLEAQETYMIERASYKAENSNSTEHFSVSPYLKAINSQVYFCKSKHYEDEQEVRLLVSERDRNSIGMTQYRARLGKIVPYIELKPKDKNLLLPITRIIIGPAHRNNEADVLEAAIQDLIMGIYPQIPQVSVSQIDYRSSR